MFWLWCLIIIHSLRCCGGAPPPLSTNGFFTTNITIPQKPPVDSASNEGTTDFMQSFILTFYPLLNSSTNNFSTSTIPALDDVSGINSSPPRALPRNSGAQIRIGERDLKRQNNPTLKAYFPEILAALLLTAFVIAFLCWYNCTKKGYQLAHNNMNSQEYKDHLGSSRNSDGGRHNRRRQTIDHGNGMLLETPLVAPHALQIKSR